VRPFYSLAKPVLLFSFMLTLLACGTTSTQVTKILHDDDYKKTRFNNILVVAVSDNYDNRAQFERTIVSGIRQNGTDATAYYTVVGHNPPVTSALMLGAVRERNFDAVLIARVKGAEQSVSVKDGSAAAQATVRGGGVFDFFRYDYEEFNEPENIRISNNVELLTQLYAVEGKKNIWAIKSDSFDRDSVALVLDSAAAAIVQQLKRDKLIGAR